MRILNKDDMNCLCVGAEILGCGGGGPIEWATEMINEVFVKGKSFKIVSPNEIPDEDLTAFVSTVGGGVSEVIRRKVSNLPRMKGRPELAAARELERFLKQEISAFIPVEIGAGNTVLPLYVSAMMDKVCVDADACGRAKPELNISTTNIKGLPITPLILVTPFEDIIVLEKTVNDYRAEDICRQLAIVSGGLSGCARCPTRGVVIRDAIIHDSISRCIKIGKEIQKARRDKQDPTDAFVRIEKGFKIFKGNIKSWNREKKEAFMWGNIQIEGTGSFKGDILKIWFKNEFLISWLNGTPYVTCPDILCILDSRTGRGLSNWIEDLNIYKSIEVAVIGIPAENIWRCAEGISIFGPKHFGYEIEYTPVEKILK